MRAKVSERFSFCIPRHKTTVSAQVRAQVRAKDPDKFSFCIPRHKSAAVDPDKFSRCIPRHKSAAQAAVRAQVNFARFPFPVLTLVCLIYGFTSAAPAPNGLGQEGGQA